MIVIDDVIGIPITTLLQNLGTLTEKDESGLDLAHITKHRLVIEAELQGEILL